GAGSGAEGAQVVLRGEETTVAEPPASSGNATGTRTLARSNDTGLALPGAPPIAAVTDAQFDALSGRVATLEGRVDQLDFQLQELDEFTRGGIAAAMAFGGTMIVPDSNVSVSLNASTFGGEQGFSGAVSARISPRIYVSAGVAGSTADDTTGGRVGVAFGF
ncbi:YadA-like family protein, partial [Qipengyuania sp. JC766]|uniref:YadA-like family protein n=1 Tax=Qipengyuania sp. JC766 TaxID=3232139 RepID=UPI003458EEC0